MILSYDVASGSEITSCIKIDKPLVTGIFFGCLRGRYKAPVPMANAYIFSQFEQKNSQSEGHFYVNQYSLQIAFIFNGLFYQNKAYDQK